MTKDELRIQVFEEILSFVQTNQIEQFIKIALKECNNDPDDALQWLIDHMDPLVQGGRSGRGIISWDFMGGYHSFGRAWFPDSDWFGAYPDLTFTYKELIAYVASGKPQNIQLELF